MLAGADDAAALDAFNAAHGARWTIDTVEAKASSSAEIVALAAALAPRYTVYVEIPTKDDPALLLTSIAAAAQKRTDARCAREPGPHNAPARDQDNGQDRLDLSLVPSPC